MYSCDFQASVEDQKLPETLFRSPLQKKDLAWMSFLVVQMYFCVMLLVLSGGRTFEERETLNPRASRPHERRVIDV